jgi:hypothetical protein
MSVFEDNLKQSIAVMDFVKYAEQKLDEEGSCIPHEIVRAIAIMFIQWLWEPINRRYDA